jgi:hypothetical protein
VDHTVITDYRDVVTAPTSVRDIASQARKLKYYNLDLMLVSGCCFVCLFVICCLFVVVFSFSIPKWPPKKINRILF